MNPLIRAMTSEEAVEYLKGPNPKDFNRYELLQIEAKAKLLGQPLCPGCNEAPQANRQVKHPNRCGWCGYNYDDGSFPVLVPA